MPAILPPRSEHRRIKMFKGSSCEDLEEQVNEFISDNNLKLLDISTNITSEDFIIITILYK